jgi:hypothetical protein
VGDFWMKSAYGESQTHKHAIGAFE